MFVNSSFILSIFMFFNLAKSRPPPTPTATPARGSCTQWLHAAATGLGGTGDGWNWGWVELGVGQTGDRWNWRRVELGTTDGTGGGWNGGWMELGKAILSSSAGRVPEAPALPVGAQCCQQRPMKPERHTFGSERPQQDRAGCPAAGCQMHCPPPGAPRFLIPHCLGFGQQLGMGWGPKAAGAGWAAGEASLGKAVQRSDENGHSFLF